MSNSRCVVLVTAFGLLATAISCSRSPASPTAPTTTPSICAPAVTFADTTFGPPGGSGTAQVKADASCGWTASSSADWLSVSTTQGAGDAAIKINVVAFAGTQSRTGQLTIAGQTFTLTQTACTLQVATSSLNFATSSGEADVAVVSDAGCQWSVQADVSWLSVSPSSGTGSGHVTIAATENRDDMRTGGVRVNDRRIDVQQAEAPCSYGLTASPMSFAVTGGAGVVHVATRNSCDWQLQPTVPSTVVFNGPLNGRGPADVPFSVPANVDSLQRISTLRAGAASVSINQSGQSDCTFAVSTVQIIAGAKPSNGSINVTTAPGCLWTTSTDAPFITLTSAGNRTGAGSVTYKLSFQDGQGPGQDTLLKGAIQLRWPAPTAGQNIWITQYRDCLMTILPNVLPGESPAQGGTRDFIAVAANSQCPWRMDTQPADWVTLRLPTNTARPDDPPGTYRGGFIFPVTFQPNPSPQLRTTSFLEGSLTVVFYQLGAP